MATSARAITFQPGRNGDCMMKIQIDGMDQSKFCVPRVRRLMSTSEFSRCWRPAIHVVGVLVWNELEYYTLLPPDSAKDSNMQCSIVARVLE